MKLFQREAWFMPLFVCLSVMDLCLRFFWFEREHWPCNTGVFWGLAIPSELLPWIILLTLGVLIFFWYHSEREEERFSTLLLFLGGSINALDRFFHGCVLDYFIWPFGLAQLLPNFNLADMLLSLGLLSYFWLHFLKKKAV